MKGLVICLFILACFVTPSFADPIQWKGNGHYYEVKADILSWYEAKDAAKALNYRNTSGYLVTINSAEENPWISTTFSETAFCQWIGANYFYSTMQQAWYWANGESWGFTNWNSGEPGPLAGIENAVSFTPMTNKSGFTWWDMNGSQARHGYIVEYSVPEPSSILLLLIGTLSIFCRKRPKSPKGLFSSITIPEWCSGFFD